MSRIDLNNYFMKMAAMASTRSTCLKRRVGAIIVQDKQILSTGYNGAPSKIEHCSTAGCVRDKINASSNVKTEICRAVHAEQNAIIQAASKGLSMKNATMYVTTQPCIICAKMIINTGITKVIYAESTKSNTLGPDILSEAGVEVRHLI